MINVFNMYKIPVEYKNSEDNILITRGTKWGNPFVINVHGDREEVLKLYEEYLINNDNLMADLLELKGKNLICCCAPKPCHGNILARYVEQLEK